MPVAPREAIECVMEMRDYFNGELGVDYRIRRYDTDVLDNITPGTTKALLEANSKVTENCACITLFTEVHKDKKDIQRSIQHELMGHLLLRTYASDQANNILDSILESRYDPSLAPAWGSVQARYPEESLRLQAEEVFAFTAETVDLNADPLLNTHRLGKSTGAVDLRDLRQEIFLATQELRQGHREINIAGRKLPQKARNEDPLIANLQLDDALNSTAEVSRSKGNVIHFKI